MNPIPAIRLFDSTFRPDLNLRTGPQFTVAWITNFLFRMPGEPVPRNVFPLFLNITSTLCIRVFLKTCLLPLVRTRPVLIAQNRESEHSGIRDRWVLDGTGSGFVRAGRVGLSTRVRWTEAPGCTQPPPLRRASGAEGGFDPPSDRSHRSGISVLVSCACLPRPNGAWYHLRSTRGVASSHVPFGPIPFPTPSDPLICASECSIRSCWCFLLEHDPMIQKSIF